MTMTLLNTLVAILLNTTPMAVAQDASAGQRAEAPDPVAEDTEMAGLTEESLPEPVDLAVTEDPVALAEVEQAPPPAISAVAVVFADISDEEVFDRAATALEETRTLKARFIQVSPSGGVYEGDLAMRRPGQLRFDYDDPSPQVIVATNGLVYVHDADLETTDTYPTSETPLKFLLSRRLDREAAELIDVIRGEDRVSLILAARDSEVEGELALAFTAPATAETSFIANSFYNAEHPLSKFTYL
ncbi:MAG: outer membrane lipoprotein carrier protein LolA, partial [Pseudomonadota bacterium]